MATTCKICGKPTHKGATKYCSRACYFKDPNRPKTGARPGTKAWNAGLTADTDNRMAKNAAGKLKNVIDRDTLYEFYVNQNLPLKTIGERYNVSKHVIRRLVEEFKLERIQPLHFTLTPETVHSLYLQGLSLAQIGSMYECSGSAVRSLVPDLDTRKNRNRARIEPDSSELRRLYWDQWLSYETIAEILGVDMSSIPYWLKKFDIPRRSLWQTRRGRDWNPPDVDMVVHLYEAEMMGTQSIADLFHVSKTHIASILKAADIPLRKSGYPNVSHYTAKDGHKVKSGLELQVDNWLSDHNLSHIYEPCLGATNYKADFLVGGTYIEIWGIIGNDHYEEKRQKKLQVYANFNLNLVSIFPDDFPQLQVLSEYTF